MQSQANQGLHGNDNENVQMRAHEPHELAVSLKNQGLAKNFANPVQIGCFTWTRTKIDGVRIRCPTIRR